jgi:hypothetical protein
VRKDIFFIVITLLLFFLCPNFILLRAVDYSSSHFILRDPVIVSGGSQSASGDFQYLSNIGQTAPGSGTSQDFIYKSGLLYLTKLPVVTITPTAPITLTSGGGLVTGSYNIPSVTSIGSASGSAGLLNQIGSQLAAISQQVTGPAVDLLDKIGSQLAAISQQLAGLSGSQQQSGQQISYAESAPKKAPGALPQGSKTTSVNLPTPPVKPTTGFLPDQLSQLKKTITNFFKTLIQTLTRSPGALPQGSKILNVNSLGSFIFLNITDFIKYLFKF